MDKSAEFKTLSSLGSWCACAHQLRRSGKHTIATPFDWTFTPIKAIEHLINTNFRDFYRHENLAPNNGGENVIDRDSGLLIQHYFSSDSSNRITQEIIDREYSAFREKFLRRVNRFRALMDSEGPHLHVLMTDIGWHRPLSARSAACSLRDTTARHYPKHKFGIVWVQLENRREPDWLERGIWNLYVPKCERGWEGDNTGWAKILGEFTISAKH